VPYSQGLGSSAFIPVYSLLSAYRHPTADRLQLRREQAKDGEGISLAHSHNGRGQ
jgi:hypothetical protein